MIRATVLTALLVAAFPAFGQMALPGKFEVTDTGSASYTIPISAVPGTAGLEPKLSLQYDSRGGNGLLGVGWSLAGLPAITRCGRTIAQDGAAGGVSYDANDRFCLDGQRLIAINGMYGSDQTEYRTERESFSKIVSYGSAGSGPAWFRVWTKAGLVMEFGNTADSRIETQGKSSARVWAINRTSDTKGNYFSVSYTEDNANGEYRPNRIDYTGNGGTAPANSVRFIYETRPDITSLYQAGSLIKTTQRMTKAQIWRGENLAWEYRATYDTPAVPVAPAIRELSRCTADGDCTPKTLTTRNDPWLRTFSGTQKLMPNGWNFNAPIQYLQVDGDFNGDGRGDFILMQGGLQHVFLSKGDGTFDAAQNSNPNGWSFPSPLGDYFTPVTGDFNGDGRADYILMRGSLEYVFISNGDGTFSGTLNTYPNGWDFNVPGHFKPVTGDFNGDGRTDYLLVRGTLRYTFLSNGDGSFTRSQMTVEGGYDFGTFSNYLIVPGDFNGDGRSDYMVTGGADQYVYLGNGDGTFMVRQNAYPNGWSFHSPPQSAYLPVIGDFNGDGLTDYLLASGTIYVTFLSKGDGAFAADQYYHANGWGFGNPPQSAYMSINGDFNGDGKTDFILTTGNIYVVFLGGGDGTFGAFQSYYPNGWNFGNPIYYYMPVSGDFDGDGKTDFMFAANNEYFIFHSAGGASTIKSIGIVGGVETAIALSPLTQSTAYVKDSGGAACAYPCTDLQGPMQVVAEVKSSNGIGGEYRSTYRYAGAKADQHGRGFLGFRQMTVKDEQTGVEQITSYRQDYPFTGLVASREKKLGTQLLNRSTNSYGSTNLGGTRRYPFLTQSLEESWELTGASLPAVTTGYQYDAFGNATQIGVSTGDGHSKATVNTYSNDAATWLLGRLTRSEVTSITPGN